MTDQEADAMRMVTLALSNACKDLNNLQASPCMEDAALLYDKYLQGAIALTAGGLCPMPDTPAVSPLDTLTGESLP